MYVRLSAGSAAPTATSSRLASSAASIVPVVPRSRAGSAPMTPGLRPPRAEVLAGFEDEDDPGEAGVEVLRRHEPAALVGVVDVHAPAAEAAPHAVVDDVVVELPEQDRGRLDLGERGGLHLHALGLQAVTAGRLQHVAGARAVAGDAAGDAQLLQRHVAAVVAEHHGQRGGAALHGLHLEHGGGADGPVRLRLGARRGTRRAAAAAARGLGAVPAAAAAAAVLLVRPGRGAVRSREQPIDRALRRPGGRSRRPGSWSRSRTAGRRRRTRRSRTSWPTSVSSRTRTATGWPVPARTARPAGRRRGSR